MNGTVQRLVAVCGVTLGAAAAARGQEALATHLWTFVEVATGTNTPVGAPDGILQPGESARLTLSVSFTPAVGSTITYTPPPGTGVGTVAGLGSVFFDILGGPGSQGTWSFHQRAAGFPIGGPGSELPGGTGRTGAGADQLSVSNTTNPVDAIWSMVWTPASYSSRAVMWQGAPSASSPNAHSSLFVQVGPGPNYIGLFIPGQFGSVSIPIVPAPGMGAFALVGVAALGRRRRR